MSDVPRKAIDVFYSYAHADEALRNELAKHLSSLRWQGIINEWYDRYIVAGTEWVREINTKLDTASIILLLISPDFMASHNCYNIEMKRALERHYANDACVIPILLRPVHWEEEPFAKLQMLPTEAKPVIAWSSIEEAFADITRGIRKAIESRYPHLLIRSSNDHRDLTRLPDESISYFMSLKEYLKPSRLRFPTESDFEQSLVYLPETYASAIKSGLDNTRRVLLVGKSGAGKTVLAIALAKQLQEMENYTVVYKDAARAKEGEGRKWHKLVDTHDRPGILYILDNCHLAPEEVNEFCLQWEGKPPKRAQCLLISRSDVGELDAQSGVIYHYFEACAHETIKIQPEKIYRGMIEKRATAYRGQAPNRYVSLEDDSAASLERQHSHNLMISQSRLEAWRHLGGALSRVKPEAVYQILIEKYLSISREALPALCVLRQFEIQAHNFFVETKLPQKEVKQLEEEKLLTSSTIHNYGLLYDLAFHPIEAREIFEAHIYRKYGRVTKSLITEEIVNELLAYLRAKPANYMAVYESLSRQRPKNILEQLLRDRDLQDYVANQFETGNIWDVIRYVYIVSKFDPSRAHQLIDRMVQDSDIQSICTQIVEHTFQDIALMLQSLQQIDAGIAGSVVTAIDLKQLARKAAEENLHSLFRLMQVLKQLSPEQANIFLSSILPETLVAKATVRNISTMIKNLQKFEYRQLKMFVTLLNMEQLAQQSEKVSFQLLFWLVHTLKEISPMQAKTLVEKLVIQNLETRVSGSDLGSVEKMIELMQEFGYPVVEIKAFIEEALDIEQIVHQVQKANLGRLFWLLRVLQKISPSTARELLKTLSPTGLASLCRSKGATISDIGNFSKVVTRQFRHLFLQQFSAQEIADICRQSPLKLIGTTLRFNFTFFQQGYLMFQEQFLEVKLKAATLEEIGRFIQHIRLVPEQGAELARGILSLLVRSETLQAAIEKSDVGGIQRLIYNIAHIDKDYLRPIQEVLEVSNLADKLEVASLKDSGFFLWNVYEYIDQRLAQDYCKIVDKQQRLRQLAEAPLEDLCLFLWNMTSISNLPHLRIFENPTIEERLTMSWDLEPGLALTLLGILALADCGMNKHTLLPAMKRNRLIDWLKDVRRINPYIMALALYGLKIYDEDEGGNLVHKYLPTLEISQLLESTMATAITPQSILLLEEIHTWLRSVSTEGEKRG